MASWYSDGSQNHVSRGIEVVEILKSTLSIPVQNFLKDPPPRIPRGVFMTVVCGDLGWGHLHTKVVFMLIVAFQIEP